VAATSATPARREGIFMQGHPFGKLEAQMV